MSTPPALTEDILTQTQLWLEWDKDPSSNEEVSALLEQAQKGQEEAVKTLTQMMKKRIAFGTAGTFFAS